MALPGRKYNRQDAKKRQGAPRGAVTHCVMLDKGVLKSFVRSKNWVRLIAGQPY
jgi:hypothetical protein